MSDHIRVITTCTSRKVAVETELNRATLPGMRAPVTLPAERLYAGEQHRRLMAGITALRDQFRVDLWVISARAGLIAGDEEIAPYDESFSGLPARQAREHGDRLGIAKDLRRVVTEPCELTVLLVGNDYFDAARLEDEVDWASPTLALVSPSRAARMPVHPHLRPLVVGQTLAREWSLPLTLLKGEIVRRVFFDLGRGSRTVEAITTDQTLLQRLNNHSYQAVSC
jgi:hypothetical protein